MTEKMEMRKEDLGKMLFKDAPKMEIGFVELEAKRFFEETASQHYLLYSRELSYFTTFKKKTDKPWVLFADFLQESYYQEADGNTVKLDNVTYIEYNRALGILEMYVKDKYFQVMPWTMEEL